jgi:uncharacterized protein
MKVTVIVIFIFFSFLSKISFCQENNKDTDMTLLYNQYKKVWNSGNIKEMKQDSKSYNLPSIALKSYRLILSEQISAGCEYLPSCSIFSLIAIKQFGTIRGILLTSDRLTRCNGNSLLETSPFLINKADDKIRDFPYQYKFN